MSKPEQYRVYNDCLYELLKEGTGLIDGDMFFSHNGNSHKANDRLALSHSGKTGAHYRKVGEIKKPKPTPKELADKYMAEQTEDHRIAIEALVDIATFCLKFPYEQGISNRALKKILPNQVRKHLLGLA